MIFVSPMIDNLSLAIYLFYIITYFWQRFVPTEVIIQVGYKSPITIGDFFYRQIIPTEVLYKYGGRRGS